MYRFTALYYAKMLMRRYERQKKQMRYMETVFKRMERIWNIKVDTENFIIEDRAEKTA